MFGITSRRCLILIYISFIFISLFLLLAIAFVFGVAAGSRVGDVFEFFESFHVLGEANSITGASMLLMIIAIFGLVAALINNKTFMACFSIILVLVAVLEISLAMACFSFRADHVDYLAFKFWNSSDDQVIHDLEVFLGCCGLNNQTETQSCLTIPTCFPNKKQSQTIQCPTCDTQIHDLFGFIFILNGIIALIISFLAFCGSWVNCLALKRTLMAKEDIRGVARDKT